MSSRALSILPLGKDEGFGITPAGNDLGKNFLFTTEIHVRFQYVTGQKFTFRGDDDLWIFVNGKLALDLGSTHGAVEGVIDFDEQAASLGLTALSSYPMEDLPRRAPHARLEFQADQHLVLRTRCDCELNRAAERASSNCRHRAQFDLRVPALISVNRGGLGERRERQHSALIVKLLETESDMKLNGR